MLITGRAILEISIVTLLLPLAGCGQPDPGGATAKMYLYVWASDLDVNSGDTDFLATIDAEPSSQDYGHVIHTAPVGVTGLEAHHAEPVAPSSGALFANGFAANRTFLFDLSNPRAPSVAGELDTVPGLSYPHDFRRLADGNVLVTMQRGDGSAEGDPGGLAMFDSMGKLIQTASASDPAFPEAKLRPYSPEVVPEIDRVLTSGRSMFFREERADDVIQIWRLSDLTLLKTLSIPRIPPALGPECVLGVGDYCRPEQYAGEAQPFEIRMLDDGSALLNTFMCSFYRITGIRSDQPAIEPVLNWPDEFGCSIPVLIGRFYIMPVMFSRMIVTLDVSDPTAPREVSRFEGSEGFLPHWVARDPGGNRIVVTTDGPGAAPTVALFDVDPATGRLSLDERFGTTADGIPGVSFDRVDWPHGSTGPAMPHAALFGD